MKLLTPKTIHMNNREEWLANRQKGIGSSEVGTILGLNPFMTPYQLWLIKTGRDKPQAENTAMRRGHFMEDAVAQWWAYETGREVIKSSREDFLIRCEEKPFMQVSPDRLYWLSEHHSNLSKGILECKTTNMPVSPDDVPYYWYCQLQYQLGVACLKKGSLAWIYAGRDFGYVDIDFDPDFFSYLCTEVEHFYNYHILGDNEPAISSSADTLRKFHSHMPGKVMEVGEDEYAAYSLLMEIKKQIKTLTEEQKQCEETLKMAFGDAEAISIDGHILATWKKGKDTEKFDDKRFIAEHPDLAAEYMVTKEGSRMFLPKQLK